MSPHQLTNLYTHTYISILCANVTTSFEPHSRLFIATKHFVIQSKKMDANKNSLHAGNIVWHYDMIRCGGDCNRCAHTHTYSDTDGKCFNSAFWLRLPMLFCIHIAHAMQIVCWSLMSDKSMQESNGTITSSLSNSAIKIIFKFHECKLW